ncbi:MAG: septum formation initiator family protein [Verrucomicrobiota bacterium]|nr:septum formation initiator family protein [Verrucomicrobiota bacterium]
MQTKSLRTKSYLHFFVFVVILAMAIILLAPSYKRRSDKKRELAEINKAIAGLKSKRRNLQEEIDNLETSPSAVERVAREKFGFSAPGEKIYHFDKQPKL